MKKFNLKREKRKLWLRQHRNAIIKYGSVGLCMFVLGMTIMYFSQASFSTRVTFDVIDARVAPFNSGDVVLTYIVDGVDSNTIMENDGTLYILSNYICDNNEVITWDNLTWSINVSNLSGKVKCKLYFEEDTSQTLSDFLKRKWGESDMIKDSDNNIRYSGSNPNNYITFNNETWRIIGIFGDNVKIVRNSDFGKQAWDTSGSNNWTRPATLKTYLNETYYNGLSNVQKYIHNHVWNIGGHNTAASPAATFLIQEKTSTDTMNIGLISPSDYGYASSSCYSNTNLNSYNSCGDSNWLYTMFTNSENKIAWTLSHSNGQSVFLVWNGNLDGNSGAAYNGNFAIFPTVYLKSTVNIADPTATGSSSSKYTINCSNSDCS